MIFLIFALLCIQSVSTLGQDNSHPIDKAVRAKNIVILYSDDQSYNTIRALGNDEIHTPNLDKLVQSGLSFNQAHVMGGNT